MREECSSAMMRRGQRCVFLVGMTVMHQLFVNNSDTNVTANLKKFVMWWFTWFLLLISVGGYSSITPKLNKIRRPVLLDDLQCKGTEDHILNCKPVVKHYQCPEKFFALANCFEGEVKQIIHTHQSLLFVGLQSSRQLHYRRS